MAKTYDQFLDGKAHLAGDFGFDPGDLPSFLFPFQRDMVAWALNKGRAAIFADCGMGKTPMQLSWAESVCNQSGGKVLIVTPLAVGAQTAKEAVKFDIGAAISRGGKASSERITITNYERLHLFDSTEFAGVVCDESSAIKNFNGKRREVVTRFMQKMRYRLLCTATAAPNDYIELGTSSEAIGAMGHVDMLSRFFKNTQGTIDTKAKWRNHSGMVPLWRFKPHAEDDFWRWVCSWARALRRPSDLGYSDEGFMLPPLVESEHTVSSDSVFGGGLFPRAAETLAEQRQDQRDTIAERCERVAEILSDSSSPAVSWCNLNAEADQLVDILEDSEQISGSMSDDQKEDRLAAFSRGDIRVLVTKPRIGAFGLNWQHCSRMTFFPSHSFEQYYQGVRRCWRFGQKHKVEVSIVTSEAGEGVLKNLKRKSSQANKMFDRLVAHLNDPLLMKRSNPFTEKEDMPPWL